MAPRERDYLREAQQFEPIGGIFGWLWIGGAVASVIWLIGAIFGDFSWLVTIGLWAGSAFCKALLREYNRTAQQVMTEGVEGGYLRLDEAGQVHRVS